MDNIFTTEEINSLSAEIDQQLQEVRATSLSDIKTVESTETNELPIKQSQAIADISSLGTIARYSRHIFSSRSASNLDSSSC